MADTKPTTVETPEEVLEAEIEELEAHTLNSGRIWAIAAVGLVLLAGAAFFVTWWDNRSQAGRVPVFAPEAIRLIEPTGFVDGTPTFRWDAVDGAASYIVMVKPTGRDEIELFRPVRETFLRPSDTESADLVGVGDYTWTVEARSSADTLIGYGEGRFTVR